MTTVQLEQVTKAFGDVLALNEVTFGVEPGMTALLGPNGAGKSTLLRLLCGLTRPDSGSIEVLGSTPGRDVALAGRIGLVPQQEALLGRLDAREFVALAARASGLPDADARARTALRRVELDPDEPRGVRTYSKGMSQRVKLAQALVTDPPLLILDEPLNGLDPVQRARMIALFSSLADEGRTVLVSSHVLDEVERFGSRILLLVRGRLMAQGDHRDIREALDDRPRQLRVRASDPRALAADLLADGAVDAATVEADGQLLLATSQVAALRSVIARVAQRHGIRLYEVLPLDETLESVFRDLVGGPS